MIATLNGNGIREGDVIVYNRRRQRLVIFNIQKAGKASRSTREFDTSELIQDDAAFTSLVLLMAKMLGFSMRKYDQSPCGPGFIIVTERSG